jgi:hypothetical protein
VPQRADPSSINGVVRAPFDLLCVPVYHADQDPAPGRTLLTHRWAPHAFALQHTGTQRHLHQNVFVPPPACRE